MTRGGWFRTVGAVLAAGLCTLGAAPATSTAKPMLGQQSMSVPHLTQVERPAVGAGSLAVRIESVTPTIPQAGDTLRVTGTIANTTDQPVAGVSAVLRVSRTPLPSRGEIHEVLAGEGQRFGEPAGGTGSVDALDSLAPGGSAAFRVSVAVDDLGLTVPGVYVTGVEARGDAGTGVQRHDLDRTFLPWWPEDTSAQPLLLTTLWPLVGAPMRDATGVLLDEQPAVEMSPAGRLDTLLAAAEQSPGIASVLLDPQVMESADDLAEGYLVRDGDGTTPGTRSREVALWLERVRSLAGDPGADVHAILYGYTDVVAAQHGRALGAVLRQRPLADELTADAVGRRIDSDVVMVPGGAADEATLRALADAEAGVAVLTDTSLPVTPPTFFTASGNVLWSTQDGDLPVLLVDSGLSAALAMPMASQAQLVAARQRLLAETLVIVTELPSAQRLAVASPAPDWSPPAAGAAMVLDTIGAAPWLTPTTVEQARSRPPSSMAHTLAEYTAEQRAQELPEPQVRRAREQARGLTSYTEALADPDELPVVARTAPTRMLSGWLRGRDEQRRALSAAISEQVADALSSVQVVSNGSITVSGASGTIPVTVENLGASAVTVGLALTSSPAQLFTADPVPPFRIESGRRTSVEVAARVNSAGAIPVSIQITTADGDPFGVPGTLTVRSSAYANAARILVRVSLGLLLFTVLVHGVRRARGRRVLRELPRG